MNASYYQTVRKQHLLPAANSRYPDTDWSLQHDGDDKRHAEEHSAVAVEECPILSRKQSGQHNPLMLTQ